MSLARVIVVFTALSITLFGNGNYSEARPDGENVESSCEEMIPYHGKGPQTSNPPFDITFSPVFYRPGTPVQVTIRACSSAKFRGFLIQARRAMTSADQAEMLGSFDPIAGTHKYCRNSPTDNKNGLIHSNNDDKSALTFNWNPPPTNQGPVQFWVTFVQEKVIFWQAVKSDVIYDDSGMLKPNPSLMTPPTTTASSCTSLLQEGEFIKNPKCGDDNCFSNCNDKDVCSFEVLFREDGDVGEYSIKTKAVGTSDMYAAIGFSSDKIMGEDSITGCYFKGGNTRLFNAKSTTKTLPNMLASDGVTMLHATYDNSIFSCLFTRVIAAGLSGDRFDLSNSWYLLFARGPYNNDELQRHSFMAASEKRYSLKGSGQQGTAPSQTTEPPVSGEVTRPSTCGESKGCVSDCSGSSCKTVISWDDDADYATYTLSSVVPSSNHYLAIGFSSDDKMGGDSVTGCASAGNGTAIVFTAETTGREEPIMFDDNEVTLQAFSMDENVMSCTFKQLKTASANGKRFDLSKKWIILFAKAGVTFNGDGTITVDFHDSNKFVSPGKYSSSDRPNVGATEAEYPMIKAHGSLMIGAWVFFASIGIIVARYYKPVWTDDLCSQKVWFQVHRFCMVLVFCATIAGFVIIEVEMGFHELLEGELHPVLGVIVVVLTVINPIMALCRPHPGTEKRPIFNWAHWFIGTAAHIIGVATIFLALDFDEAQLPDYTFWILVGFVAWQVLIALILEMMQCCGREEARQEMYEMDDLNNQKQPAQKESQKTITMKRVVLLVHVFVLAAVTAILIGFLNIGKNNLGH